MEPGQVGELVEVGAAAVAGQGQEVGSALWVSMSRVHGFSFVHLGKSHR